MDYQELLLSVRLLPQADQTKLLNELMGTSQEEYLSIRKEQLFNKQVGCPHCTSKSYYKFGTDKGCQRFKCKGCMRTFTEFTGTWIDGLHKKSQVTEYIDLMIEGKSLDKISAQMGINKKTALDWRHKILSALEQDSGDKMEGVVESDETFFEESQKGSHTMTRKARKRGKSSKDKKTRGISSNKAAVIVTADRKGNLNMCVATTGRISKEDIFRSIEKPLPQDAILCTDGHVSYKGYAMDNKLKHIALRGDLKQHVKHGVYHIQNINNIHGRLKKWIDNQFWGVSTKYLQNYLGWFRINEKLKGSVNQKKELITASLQNTDALKRFHYIDVSYQWLLATQ